MRRRPLRQYIGATESHLLLLRGLPAPLRWTLHCVGRHPIVCFETQCPNIQPERLRAQTPFLRYRCTFHLQCLREFDDDEVFLR